MKIILSSLLNVQVRINKNLSRRNILLWSGLSQSISTYFRTETLFFFSNKSVCWEAPCTESKR